MNHVDLDGVYQDLCEHMAGAPDTDAWEIAIDERTVSEYHQGEIDIDELADRVKSIAVTVRRHRSLRRLKSKPGPPPGTVDYRFWARSEVFALEASRSSDVTSFRNTQLPAGLLDPNDVAKWIEDRLEREGAPDVWLTVREQDLRGELRRLDVEGFRRSVQEISWTEPESEGVRRRAINSNRTLAQLRSISARLTRRYGWQRAAATTFVLAGVTPPALRLSWTANDRWPWRRARQTIALEISLDVAPTEVAAHYRRLRNEMLQDEPKTRSLSEPQASLAVFAARNRPGRTWKQVRLAWNRAHPEKQYPDDARFTKECRESFKRVIGEDINTLIDNLEETDGFH